MDMECRVREEGSGREGTFLRGFHCSTRFDTFIFSDLHLCSFTLSCLFVYFFGWILLFFYFSFELWAMDGCISEWVWRA